MSLTSTFVSTTVFLFGEGEDFVFVLVVLEEDFTLFTTSVLLIVLEVEEDDSSLSIFSFASASIISESISFPESIALVKFVVVCSPPLAALVPFLIPSHIPLPIWGAYSVNILTVSGSTFVNITGNILSTISVAPSAHNVNTESAALEIVPLRPVESSEYSPWLVAQSLIQPNFSFKKFLIELKGADIIPPS